MKEPSEKLNQSLARLKSLRDELPLLGNSIMNSKVKEFYPFDFVTIGIIKRSLNISTAIVELVENLNMVCARALLRMQLDTALRLFAFWIVNDSQDLASKVMGGVSINKSKDRDGNKMTDSYLARKLGEAYDWVPRVYKYTSGYIHFSERHLFDPISEMNEEERTVSFIITNKDEKFPEFSWLELVDCSSKCLEIIRYFLKDYERVKNEG